MVKFSKVYSCAPLHYLRVISRVERGFPPPPLDISTTITPCPAAQVVGEDIAVPVTKDVSKQGAYNTCPLLVHYWPQPAI